jgi:dihydrofolate synthase/folylpolyglutamate synthase
MSFEAASAYLDSLGIDAMKTLAPSLERIEALCELLDHPEQRFPTIHITGTNGKSSVARIATSLLTEAGLAVGTFTSPHLETVRERICLGGVPISEDDFGEVFDHLSPYLSVVESTTREKVSYFETLVAMFLLWAADQPVDVAVVEVGLGGRWDATNVVRSPVCVMTNISLDHTALLGADRLTIAKEKAGIVKQDATVVVGERSPDVLAIVAEEAEAVGATVLSLDRDFGVTENSLAVGGRLISVRTRAREYEDLFLPLHGAHQAVNAAVALEAVTSFLPPETLEDEVIAEGLTQVKVPGRMEQIGGVILDVAHNPSGMSAFVSALVEAFVPEETIVVVGFLDDKDYRGMLSELSRMPARLIATKAASPRAVQPSEIASAAAEFGLHSSVEPDPIDAVRAAMDHSDETLVCVTGSHYLVGEVRGYLLESDRSTKWRNDA